MKPYADYLADLKAQEAAGTMKPFAEQLAEAKALNLLEGRPFAVRDDKYVICATDEEMQLAKARTAAELVAREAEAAAKASRESEAATILSINVAQLQKVKDALK